MSFESTCVTVPDTFVGLGISERSLDVEIYAEYRPSYSSSYSLDPPESAEFNVLRVRVTGMCAAVCLDECVLREDHEDWFVVLDKIALVWATDNYDYLIDEWLEVLADGS